MTIDEQISKLEDMSRQILTPRSKGKEFFAGVADSLREIRKDKERMDWLETQRGDITKNGGTELIGYGWGIRGQTDSIRDAIDSAMSDATK